MQVIDISGHAIRADQIAGVSPAMTTGVVQQSQRAEVYLINGRTIELDGDGSSVNAKRAAIIAAMEALE